MENIRDWLLLHPRELVFLSPNNFHSSYSNTEEMWKNLFAEKFGDECVRIDASTNASSLPSKETPSCLDIQGWPSDEITMGLLIQKNLRFVITYDNRKFLRSTYSENNAGATSKGLLEHIQNTADGTVRNPMTPNTTLAFKLVGGASQPDFSTLQQCRSDDPICKVQAAQQALEEMDVRCVETMSVELNTGLLQDDTNPHEFFAEKECPDALCGCLGYQSPLEPVHQKLLDDGHYVFVVMNDYSELGEKQNIADLTRRMNYANLRRWYGEPEPVKTWWDCNWSSVLGIALPSAMVLLCACYMFLICLFPDHYGLWIKAAWRKHQDLKAVKRIAREEGREEARAYLRNANGAADDNAYGNAYGNAYDNAYGVQGGAPYAQNFGVTSVAPPPAVVSPIQMDGFYKAKETE